jgi:hypothetical protein
MATSGPLGIYKLLPRTNCRECGLKSCMAFASALLRDEADPDACPYIAPENKDAISAIIENISPQEGFRETINTLRREVSELKLASIAEGLGARYQNGKLYIPCLGRDFIVRDDGHLESVCHVNIWVELMLLSYCRMSGQGMHSGRWVSYAELPSAAPTAPYFEKRCEEPLRALADAHTDTFLDLLSIFGGRKIDGFEADYAYVLHPLPKVPFLLLYTRPEPELGEDMPSSLRVLVDASVTTYMPKEAIIYIGRGIVEMLKKILSRHRECTKDLLAMQQGHINLD